MSGAMYKVAALYKFVSLPDHADLKKPLVALCRARSIRGTLLLAPEGINGTVAGTPADIDALIDRLENGEIFGGRLRGAEIRYSPAENQPFRRMKVRLKPEIVTLRAPEADPTQRVGTYVAPKDWNTLIARDDVTLVDTRNDYEVSLGTFPGALDPSTKSFTEFKRFAAENLDPARDKKVAMFCTGGIRCEKASSWLLAQGFDEVYHLKGGILNYLETIPDTNSQWSGECFVFDERVTVTHGLARGTARLCRTCRQPLTEADRTHADYIEGVQCPHCAGPHFAATRRAATERQRQMELADQRGLAHIGDDAAGAAHARRRAKKDKRAADRARNTGGVNAENL